MSTCNPPRGEMEHAICKNPACGRAFQRRVADRKRGWAKCCSKSCAAKLKFGAVAKARATEPAPRQASHTTRTIELGELRTSSSEFDFHDLDDAL